MHAQVLERQLVACAVAKTHFQQARYAPQADLGGDELAHGAESIGRDRTGPLLRCNISCAGAHPVPELPRTPDETDPRPSILTIPFSPRGLRAPCAPGQ